MSVITSLAGGVESILANALRSVGLTSSPTSSSLSSTSAPAAAPSDNSQLSPLGQVLSSLQQLQQSNPAQYKQVTQQVAANLQTAAQTATSQGNTAAANQLSQLSSDFTNASTSGQLPNIQDLAQAASGGHHHHHHAASSSSGTTPQSQSDSLNPLTIIGNTLTNAGVTSANS